MSAEVLRRAAALMRERAEAVVPLGVWIEGDWKADPATPLINYTASWRPAVALPVADWLDAQAEQWRENFEATQRPSRGVDDPPAINHGNPQAAALAADYHARHALTVARAYLGTEAPR